MPRRAPLHCREIDGPLRVVAPMTIRGIDRRGVRKGSSRAPNLMQPIAVGRAAVRYAGVHRFLSRVSIRSSLLCPCCMSAR